MAATPGLLPEFDPTHPEKGEARVECLKYFVEFQGIKGATKKKALLLSPCGIGTLELAEGLSTPTSLQLATFDGLITVLTNHFVPQPTQLARYLDFFKQNQKPNKSASDYVTALH